MGNQQKNAGRGIGVAAEVEVVVGGGGRGIGVVLRLFKKRVVLSTGRGLRAPLRAKMQGTSRKSCNGYFAANHATDLTDSTGFDALAGGRARGGMNHARIDIQLCDLACVTYAVQPTQPSGRAAHKCGAKARCEMLT